MPKEVANYLNTSNKQITYSGDEIQMRFSFLCGYWCLYYLLGRQNGKSILTTIHNAKFNMNDQWVNNRFIMNYVNHSVLNKKKNNQTECVEPSGYIYIINKQKMVDMFYCTCAECGIKKTRFVKKNNLNLVAPHI